MYVAINVTNPYLSIYLSVCLSASGVVSILFVSSDVRYDAVFGQVSLSMGADFVGDQPDTYGRYILRECCFELIPRKGVVPGTFRQAV